MKKRIIFLLFIIFCVAPIVKTQETVGRADAQEKREMEEALEHEAQRAEEKAVRAEFEAQRAYRENLRIEEMERHLKSKHKKLESVLQELQEKENFTYQKVLRELYGQFDNLRALEEENKELANLETEVRAIEIKLKLQEKDYKKIKDENAKKDLKAELQNQLENLFDLKVKKRELEIDSIESELDKLHDELTKIKRNKNKSIEMKLQQMTEGDVFSW